MNCKAGQYLVCFGPVPCILTCPIVLTLYLLGAHFKLLLLPIR